MGKLWPAQQDYMQTSIKQYRTLYALSIIIMFGPCCCSFVIEHSSLLSVSCCTLNGSDRTVRDGSTCRAFIIEKETVASVETRTSERDRRTFIYFVCLYS